jgi:hypothetical protein
MATPTTCGQGLASNAALPAKLAELLDTIADNLAAHVTALDPSEDAGAQEIAAYESLTDRHRGAATELRLIAEEMLGYRDLPPAGHDPAALGAPAIVAAFEDLVRVENELSELLEQRAREWAALRDS